jgi:diguanylate cyclase (GGDEF)-like protein
VPAQNQFQALVQALRDAGVNVRDGASRLDGFPLVLNMAAWPPIVLDVPDPGVLSLFDPESFGLAIIDTKGHTRARWGIASRLPEFSDVESLTSSAVGALVEKALHGEDGSAYIEGRRYYASAYTVGAVSEVMVLVADAADEAQAREASKLLQLSTKALKRIGKALSSKQTIRSLAIPAIHAIYSTYELAAALLWVKQSDESPLKLLASIGTNRSLSDIETLDEDSPCIAALAVKRSQHMVLKDVKESPVTANIEAKLCTSTPGSAIVIPLMSAKKLIGVLELVARKEDGQFAENEEIFTTIAEHLALAIHNAIMFEEAERLAAFDPLTGINNHRTMQEYLAKRIGEAQRSGDRVAAIMVDVDEFRSFNEHEGHDAGDRVLKLVAQALSAHVRGYDMAARYGGEEFTIVLANADVATALDVAERARKAIEALHITCNDGTERQITASFGCASFPDSAHDAASLLKAADLALYEAKRSGRNCTVVYAPGMDGPQGPKRRSDAA